MKIKIYNLWLKGNTVLSDFFTLDVLSFQWVDYQIAIVIFNFNIVIEY